MVFLMLIFKLMLGCFILPNRFITMSNRQLMLTILACFFVFVLFDRAFICSVDDRALCTLTANVEKDMVYRKKK